MFPLNPFEILRSWKTAPLKVIGYGLLMLLPFILIKAIEIYVVGRIKTRSDEVGDQDLFTQSTKSSELENDWTDQGESIDKERTKTTLDSKE